jgi:hypothetical protein
VLNLKYHELLSSVSFKSNLRRFTMAGFAFNAASADTSMGGGGGGGGGAAVGGGGGGGGAWGGAIDGKHNAVPLPAQQQQQQRQGLTLVPISAQLELFCPPYNSK